jgi:DNA-binding response OmpR family regulator
MGEGTIKTVMLFNSPEEAKELTTHLGKTEYKFNVTVADNLDHFVALSGEGGPVECFFLDWDYSQYSMIELVQKLRKSNKYRKTPIVFVTDKKDVRTPMQYAALEADLVIPRPFQLNEFNMLFKAAVGKKMSRIIPENYDVLILDDKEEILELMVDHMREMKHTRFQTCASIAEAKKILDEKDFDLFLLDWNLGDGTCIDLIDYIRAKKDNKRLGESLIIVVTGRNDVDDIMTLVRYNIKDHIIKPFDYPELEEKLIYAIDRHRKTLKK